MRQLGTLNDEQDARMLADYLVAQGIFCHAEHESEGWVIWVREENQLTAAREVLAEFQQEPRDAKFAQAASSARRVRQEQSRRQVARNVIDVRRQWSGPLRSRAPVTYTVIVLCVLATLTSGFGVGFQSATYSALAFCERIVSEATGDGLAQIRQGQVWRLVTPIFMHGDLMHLLLNMSCIYYFGPILEGRLGSFRYVGFIILTAGLSNACEFFVSHSPNMVGISGVIFGMVGYMWLYSLRQPRSAFPISPGTMNSLWIVLVIGFVSDVVPLGIHIANWAHVGGLLVGLGLAFAATSGQNGYRAA